MGGIVYDTSKDIELTSIDPDPPQGTEILIKRFRTGVFQLFDPVDPEIVEIFFGRRSYPRNNLKTFLNLIVIFHFPGFFWRYRLP